jgi:hypothetical protein
MSGYGIAVYNGIVGMVKGTGDTSGGGVVAMGMARVTMM